jgi:hypothetical protein
LETLRETHKLGAAGYQIHHIVPKWLSRRVNITERAVQDTSPGLTMPNKRLSPAEEAQYFEKFNERPVYHHSAGEPRSLENALRSVPRPNPAGTVEDKRAMLEGLKAVYTSAEFNHLNMWPVARAWLLKQSQLQDWPTGLGVPSL